MISEVLQKISSVVDYLTRRTTDTSLVSMDSISVPACGFVVVNCNFRI